MSKSEKNLDAVFQDTADAIREKTGSNELISPLDFADEIKSIPTGITPTGTIPITENGIHDVSAYAEANVNVPSVQPSGIQYLEFPYIGTQYYVGGKANVVVDKVAVTRVRYSSKGAEAIARFLVLHKSELVYYSLYRPNFRVQELGTGVKLLQVSLDSEMFSVNMNNSDDPSNWEFDWPTYLVKLEDKNVYYFILGIIAGGESQYGDLQKNIHVRAYDAPSYYEDSSAILQFIDNQLNNVLTSASNSEYLGVTDIIGEDCDRLGTGKITLQDITQVNFEYHPEPSSSSSNNNGDEYSYE